MYAERFVKRLRTGDVIIDIKPLCPPVYRTVTKINIADAIFILYTESEDQIELRFRFDMDDTVVVWIGEGEEKPKER